ncbi:hypothetical protein CO709_27070 [Burkholderia thailandensis]|nr:hypothetical protein CO709_27070 [Burkholderia thailandensis]
MRLMRGAAAFRVAMRYGFPASSAICLLFRLSAGIFCKRAGIVPAPRRLIRQVVQSASRFLQAAALRAHCTIEHFFTLRGLYD